MHKHGLYPDGSAGTTLHLMVTAQRGVAVLSGAVPVWTDQLAGQRLRVYSGRRLLGSYPVTGNFRIALQHHDPTVPLSVRIEASHHASSPRDPRRLAFLFGAFAWQPQEEDEAYPVV